VWSLKRERWGSLLVWEKYREEKACDKRHPYRILILILIIIIIIINSPNTTTDLYDGNFVLPLDWTSPNIADLKENIFMRFWSPTVQPFLTKWQLYVPIPHNVPYSQCCYTNTMFTFKVQWQYFTDHGNHDILLPKLYFYWTQGKP
jgi:hypothetical protein